MATTLSLDTLTVLSATALRVRFTSVPQAADSTGANDALNPANYTIAGNTVRKVDVVDGDTRALDLTLAEPMHTGSWLLSVANIQTAFGVVLSGTNSLSVSYSNATFVPSPSLGALDTGPESYLRKHLGPAFIGKAWNALIAALAQGDKTNWDNAQLAFDQKFKSSASGRYLDRKLSDDGINRPATMGISDDLFRRYGIKIAARKLTSQSILDMLEVFYGADAVRAVATSTTAEPYAIAPDDTLSLTLDEKTSITITFVAADFAIAGAATALEVAAAITRYLRSGGAQAYAIAYQDPTTHTNLVKVYSAASGLGSSIRITGGAAQSVLLFPTNKINTYSPNNRTVVLTHQAGSTQIFLPATTQAVVRTKGSGAYLQTQTPVAASIARTPAGVLTVTTTNPHGLVTGQQVLIENASATGEVPAITAGTTTATSASLGSFFSTITPGVSNPRTKSTQVLLLDGSVLMVGGSSGSSFFGTAQRFTITGSVTLTDGSTQYTYSWTAPPSIVPIDSAAGSVIPATALRRVGLALISGGQTGTTTATNTTNLYDPVANAWTAGPAMNSIRAAHTSTVMGNHKILLVGGAVTGMTGGAAATATADLYDTLTGLISAAPSMSTARMNHVAVLLQSGKVLVAGGRPTVGGAPTNWCELYDPATNTWSRTGQMTYSRYGHQGVALPDGRVLVAGGHGFNTSQSATQIDLSSTEIYDPSTGAWSPAGNGNLSTPRAAGFSMVYLPTVNKVLAFGNSTNPAQRTCDYFDVANGQWIVAPFLTGIDRLNAGVTVLNNGAVLVSNGTDLAGTAESTMEIFIPGADRYASGSLNGIYRIASVPNATHFTVQSDAKGYAVSSNGTYTALTAPPSTTLSGPYIFDTNGGFAITATSSTSLTGGQFAGQHYNTLQLAANAGFADAPASIVLGYGTALEQGPIRVIGMSNSTTLLLDPKYKFTQNNPDGTSVTMLASLGGFAPAKPQTVGSFYLTASGAGRQTASNLLDTISASGIPLTKTVLYPGDRGLGNEGQPHNGIAKLSDTVSVFGGDDNLDGELTNLRGE